MVKGLPNIQHPNEMCENFVLNKQHKSSFGSQANRRLTKALELIHSNVCCPTYPISNEQYRYFHMFIENYSIKP